MNNWMISFVIALVSSFLMVITEKKETGNRQAIAIRTFLITFFVSFVALTYLLDGNCGQDIDISEPNF